MRPVFGDCMRIVSLCMIPVEVRITAEANCPERVGTFLVSDRLKYAYLIMNGKMLCY